VVFHAQWCPTCRAQAPLLKELVQSPIETLDPTLPISIPALKKSGGDPTKHHRRFKDGKGARLTGARKDSLAVPCTAPFLVRGPR
jgi:thiol-disulfide isomerase/thioredoxin